MKRLLSAPLDRPTRRATSASEGGVSASVESNSAQARATGLLRPSIGLPVARLAALAGAEARRLGRIGRGVEGHVLAQRRAGRTGRQAIDPGRLDREPEPAVEGPVAPLDGLPAGIRVGSVPGWEVASAKVGEGKRMLGHGAIKAPWPNLLYPAAAGNSRPGSLP